MVDTSLYDNVPEDLQGKRLLIETSYVEDSEPGWKDVQHHILGTVVNEPYVEDDDYFVDLSPVPDISAARFESMLDDKESKVGREAYRLAQLELS